MPGVFNALTRHAPAAPDELLKYLTPSEDFPRDGTVTNPPDQSWLDYLGMKGHDAGHAAYTGAYNLAGALSPVAPSEDGSRWAGQVPPMISGPAHAAANLFGTPNAPGHLWEGPGAGSNSEDMNALIMSGFGGNAFNPMRGRGAVPHVPNEVPNPRLYDALVQTTGLENKVARGESQIVTNQHIIDWMKDHPDTNDIDGGVLPQEQAYMNSLMRQRKVQDGTLNSDTGKPSLFGSAVAGAEQPLGLGAPRKGAGVPKGFWKHPEVVKLVEEQRRLKVPTDDLLREVGNRFLGGSPAPRAGFRAAVNEYYRHDPSWPVYKQRITSDVRAMIPEMRKTMSADDVADKLGLTSRNIVDKAMGKHYLENGTSIKAFAPPERTVRALEDAALDADEKVVARQERSTALAARARRYERFLNSDRSAASREAFGVTRKMERDYYDANPDVARPAVAPRRPPEEHHGVIAAVKDGMTYSEAAASVLGITNKYQGRGTVAGIISRAKKNGLFSDTGKPSLFGSAVSSANHDIQAASGASPTANAITHPSQHLSIEDILKLYGM
jgi:hypothetical protein